MELVQASCEGLGVVLRRPPVVEGELEFIRLALTSDGVTLGDSLYFTFHLLRGVAASTPWGGCLWRNSVVVSVESSKVPGVLITCIFSSLRSHCSWLCWGCNAHASGQLQLWKWMVKCQNNPGTKQRAGGRGGSTAEEEVRSW